MTLRVLIANAFTDTLPLKAANVATKLAALTVPEAYIDSLVEGTPVSIDPTDGCAIVSTGIIANDHCVGLIVNGALYNAQANYSSLANKQITYVAGPALISTDNVVAGVAYLPGDYVYAGNGAAKGKLSNSNSGGTDRILGIVKQGRQSSDTTPIVVLLI